ncbi:hypothetical protein pEaSNUABM38_00094 [Erwinia phage pEa_SNUABM_38]|nr:hypothetical protein pEaSNUABM38_00094 [Erwinia phage pEa_SNUABM_38]
MFKFEAIDILNNIDTNALENNYAVNWGALNAAGFRFDAYHGEKDATEYLLIVAGRNVGMITRTKGIVEAVRVADDAQNRHALETLIEKNLDWRFYENGSLSYTVQKPRAFLARLFGKKATNIGALKEEVKAQLKNAQEKLAKAKEELAKEGTPEAVVAGAMVDELTQVVQAMSDDVNSPEVLAEETKSETKRTLGMAVAAINHNGMTSRERILAMRALLELEEYADDPQMNTLRANLAMPPVVRPEPPVEVTVVVVEAAAPAAEAEVQN